ncbi:MAG: ATP-binding cassette domain-containing protein, partial [Flavisolibacter sp.]
MSFLQLSGVSRREEGTFLVRDVSFKQEKNRKLAIAGATGSGKTTLLKMIAGLIQPSEGAVFFEGQKVQGPEERLLPGHPGIAYLSQHFELRNHYRVSEIIAMARQLPEAAVDQICRVCRIDHLLGRWTHQVSG